MYSFCFERPPGYKVYKEPRIKHLQKLNKSVLSYIIFSLEDDDHKLLDFNKETIAFTCQLVKFYINIIKMNIDMVRPKKTEDLLLLINKNYETFFKITHRRPQETLEVKLAKSREI